MNYVHIENLVYGEDGEQPLRRPVEEYLKQASDDGVRLKIEIRSHMKGTPKSSQERVFDVDPKVTTVDRVMETVHSALQDSPGEDFSGKIRINFSQAGTSSRYGSFQRTVRAGYEPNTVGVGVDLDDFDGGDNSLGDLQGMPSSLGHMNLGFGGGGSGSVVSDEQMRQWLDTLMNFNFRAMAQNQAMFDRAMQMVESLHYGMARPIEPGIVEHKGGEDQGNPLGLLGALLNAAGAMATAKDPAEAVQTAAQMAAGQPPPTGAARQAAISTAARVVRGIRSGSTSEAPEDPGEERFPIARYNEGMDPEDFLDDDPDDPDDDEGPDLTGLSPEEMKEVFLSWLRADPSRKGAVMSMLPDLSKEVM